MHRAFLTMPLAVAAMACSLQDTTAPVPQPDALILGRIAAIRDASGGTGGTEVEIRAGLPEAMREAIRKDRGYPPGLERDVVVRVRVSDETVCVRDMQAVDLDAFKVGQEVAVVPAGGTTAMVGSKLVTADASEFYLFRAYQLRYLARSLSPLPSEIALPNDPARINSAGMEMTPIPLHEGRVVYFAAGLLPPPLAGKDAKPIGAVRPGMTDKDGALASWAVNGYRPYRVAWRQSGWEAPRPVELPGVASDVSARVTWVNEDETSCLVELTKGDGIRSLFSSTRGDASGAWGALQPLTIATGGSVGDAQRFGNKLLSLVWTVYDAGGSDLWLSKEGAVGERLDPRIDTLGPEYAPRVGPGNVLYFCRGDYQLLFAGGVVQEVRLPGRQRHPLLDATPTKSGAYLFFRVPRYTPGQLDWNLAVAPKAGASWGNAVLLDDWKPE